MSLRQRLKNRFFSIQDDLTSGMRNLSSSTVVVGDGGVKLPRSPVYRGRSSGAGRRRRLESAGADLLSHYQDEWASLHAANEANAKAARRCDASIASLLAGAERDWRDVAALQALVAHLPKVFEQVAQVAGRLAELESSFSRAEVALLALEDAADACEMGRRREEEWRKAREYEERRKKQFAELSNRLSKDFARKKQELSKRDSQRSSEGQQQMQKGASSVVSPANMDFLQVPKKDDPDASLETVDLDEDEEGLEAFLGDVPDAPPLPEDEEGVSNVTLTDKGEENGQVSNMLNVDLLQEDEVGEAASRAESMYFTPSDTLENLAEDVKSVKLED